MHIRKEISLTNLVILCVTTMCAHFFLVTFPYLQQDHVVWITSSLPDDAFYYLQCAWNFTRGQGLSMDGLETSNGFHPLWMAACVVMASLSESKEHLLTVMMWVLVGVYYLSALIWALSMGRLFKSYWLLWAGCCFYLAIPQLFLMHLNGLETGFVLLFTTATLLALVFFLEQVRVNYVTIILVAICAGFTLVSRTDTVFFSGTIGLLIVTRCMLIRNDDAPFNAKTALRHGVLASLTFAIPIAAILMPWILWNLVQFGSIMQDSGYIVPFERWKLREDFHSGNYVTWLGFWRRHFSTQFTGPFSQGVLDIGFYGLLFLCMAGCASVLFTKQRHVSRTFLMFSAPLFLFFALQVLVHTFVRLMPRPWYFVSAQQLSILALCGIVYLLLNAKFVKNRHILGFIGILAFSLIVLGWDSYRAMRGLDDGLWPWQQRLLYSDVHYDKLRQRGVHHVGDSDGGIITYFAPQDFTITNLDGKINARAAQAITSGVFADYIVDSTIQEIRMRTSLGSVVSVMGRDDFRRFFDIQTIGPSRYYASVLRSESEIHRNLLLPASGIITPGQFEHWSHLLGDWQFWKGELSHGMAVHRPGIQFALEELPPTLILICRMKAPFEGQRLEIDVLLNGQVVDTLTVDASMRDYQIPLSKPMSSETIQEITLAVPEAKSAVDLGLGLRTEKVALIVEHFKFQVDGL